MPIGAATPARTRIGTAVAALLLACTLAAPVRAEAPLEAPRPSPRPGGVAVASFAEGAASDPAAAPDALGALTAALAPEGPDDAPPIAPASGEHAFALLEIDTGRMRARRRLDLPLPPASVAKAPTALYALDALGPAHRFETRLEARGPIDHGVLLGDLVLVGGGDPTLDTADLVALVSEAKAAGLAAVAGRFLYDDRGLPSAERILVGQPPQAPYNPGFGALNLNFNRVRVAWRGAPEAGERLRASAEAAGAEAPAETVIAEAADDGAPGFAEGFSRQAVGPDLFAPDAEAGPGALVERWRIARRLLRSAGQRWLPVRAPAPYAAATFRALAAREGLRLPPPARIAADDAGFGTPIAVALSDPLDVIVADMLDYSTNVTAEMVGLAASRARGVNGDLVASGAAMSAWANTRFGLDGVGAQPIALENHSGLSLDSRLSARALVVMLTETARDPALGPMFRALMPEHRVKGLARGARVLAKTGTIYYARTLSGYLDCPNGRRFAFASLAGDIAARARFDATVDVDEPEATPGEARAWLGRARGVENALLVDWSKRFCR